MIKTGKELASSCEQLAKNYKTLYVLGCIGAPLTDAAKTRYTNNLDYNKKSDRKKKILAASADTFGMDCVCMVKTLLWGWCGDADKVYGGAKYASNGVPDIGTEQIIGVCSGVTTDFSKIDVGELLWMQGHVGVYIGGGLAVECTPSWKDGVQITAVHNIGTKSGYNGRKWTKHGKLPYVTYEAEEADPGSVDAKQEQADALNLRSLKKGCEGADVEALQILLVGRGYDCGTYGPGKNGVDGQFGKMTESAVCLCQRKNGMPETGVADIKLFAALLGV